MNAVNIRRWTAAVGAVGALGLVGVGVNSSYTGAVSAVEHQSVGTFGCTLSSTDPNAVGNGTNAVTINLPPIRASGSGNYENDLTVHNAGTITTVVHWTEATGGTIVWQPTGRMGYAAGTVADPMSTDLTLAGGASHTYSAVGFMWAELTNADLGQTASVTYTANCGEVPAAPASNISFVGLATEAGHAALTFPAGTHAGDYALVLEAATGIVSPPTGYTQIAQPVAPRGNLSYRVLVAGDTAVPAAATTVTDMQVAVYRGVAGIGSHTYYSANSNNVGLSGGSPLYYPLKATPLDGVSGPAMTKTNGSSWVVAIGYDAYASTNMSQMSFNAVVSVGPPYVIGGSMTTNRSAATADAHMGLADSAAGVAAWGASAWGIVGDNFPLPGTHGVAVHTVELLST